LDIRELEDKEVVKVLAEVKKWAGRDFNDEPYPESGYELRMLLYGGDGTNTTTSKTNSGTGDGTAHQFNTDSTTHYIHLMDWAIRATTMSEEIVKKLVNFQENGRFDTDEGGITTEPGSIKRVEKMNEEVGNTFWGRFGKWLPVSVAGEESYEEEVDHLYNKIEEQFSLSNTNGGNTKDSLSVEHLSVGLLQQSKLRPSHKEKDFSRVVRLAVILACHHKVEYEGIVTRQDFTDILFFLLDYSQLYALCCSDAGQDFFGEDGYLDPEDHIAGHRMLSVEDIRKCRRAVIYWGLDLTPSSGGENSSFNTTTNQNQIEWRAGWDGSEAIYAIMCKEAMELSGESLFCFSDFAFWCIGRRTLMDEGVVGV